MGKITYEYRFKELMKLSKETLTTKVLELQQIINEEKYET